MIEFEKKKKIHTEVELNLRVTSPEMQFFRRAWGLGEEAPGQRPSWEKTGRPVSI